MVLVKIDDLYPNFTKGIFNQDDIKSFSVYDNKNNQIGSVHDIIVDEAGKFRYLVIDTEFWIFGKKVLLPIGRANINRDQERVYTQGLTREQTENLPEYDEDMTIDYDYEEKVRKVYRGVEYNQSAYDQNSYSYDHEPSLYAHQETDGRQSLKLYEERLVANKERFLAGTVTVGKKVETETATVSVPVEKERVIVERTTLTNNEIVTPGEAVFNQGEVAKIEVFEESADIEKQAFVREEVSVRKEVDKDTVSAQETIRREELDIETDGTVVVN